MLKVCNKIGYQKQKQAKGTKISNHIILKWGQLIAIKNQLRNTFETKFVSDYRILKIVTGMHSLDPKSQWQNIKLILTMQNQFQPLHQQRMPCKNSNNQCKERNIFTCIHYTVPPCKYMKQLSN